MEWEYVSEIVTISPIEDSALNFQHNKNIEMKNNCGIIISICTDEETKVRGHATCETYLLTMSKLDNFRFKHDQKGSFLPNITYHSITEPTSQAHIISRKS